MQTNSSHTMFLLGRNIAHSLSPQMFKAAFDALGLSAQGWTYELCDCATEEEALTILNSGNYAAINVTTPYKKLALNAADKVDLAAQHAFGSNLIINSTVKLATNTDGFGCVGFLLREGVAIAGKRVVVCGTGPTALAICDSLMQTGVDSLTIMSRNATKAAAHARAFESDMAENTDACGSYVHLAGLSYDSADAGEVFANADIVIDATTLGMNTGDSACVPQEFLHAGQVVLDTVYGHGTTELAKRAAAAGATFYDGKGMLGVQAALTLQNVCLYLNLGVEVNFKVIYDAMVAAISDGMAKTKAVAIESED